MTDAATGTKTRLADRYTVSASLAGRLARINLKEGDAVAVQVPVSAVFPLPGTADAAADRGASAAVPTRFAVFVADEGHARQTAVDLGARNGNAAWIRSGVTTGQLVIAYPPATVRDGLRVASRKP